MTGNRQEVVHAVQLDSGAIVLVKTRGESAEGAHGTRSCESAEVIDLTHVAWEEGMLPEIAQQALADFHAGGRGLAESNPS